MSLWSWLKNAFLVETAESLEVTPEVEEIIERLGREIIKRRLETPALIFLETSRPLNGIASHSIGFLEPILGTIGDPVRIAEFRKFLEHRGSVEYLCRRIEELAAQREET